MAKHLFPLFGATFTPRIGLTKVTVGGSYIQERMHETDPEGI